MTDPIEAIAFYLVFVFSVTIHEAAHAWAAMVGGDLTAYNGGQVSIDPIPHMKREPFGMVIMPILSVATMGWPLGYASAPYNIAWAERYPKRAAWMALAGPGANLAMVVVIGLIVRVGMAMDYFRIPEQINFTQITQAATQTGGEASGLAMGVVLLLSISFSMNLLLFVLNMLPLPPLDGSGALPLILPESWLGSYRAFIHQPMIGLVGILIVWNLIGEVFTPMLLGAIGLLYPGVSYG